MLLKIGFNGGVPISEEFFIKTVVGKHNGDIALALFPGVGLHLVTYDNRASGNGLAPWPARLTSPPPTLADFGYSNDMFEKDTELRQRRVEKYWDLMSPKITSNTLRNIMDMKANMSC